MRSQAPSQIETTTLATALLIRLVSALASDMKRSMPTRIATPATGMSGIARTLRVELPVSVPAIIAGLRTAAVSCVTLASASAVVGVRGLGTLFTEGYDTGFETEVLVGIAAVALTAFAADVVLVRAARAFAPWSKLVPVR